MSSGLHAIGRSFASWRRLLPHGRVLLVLPRLWLRRLDERHELAGLDEARLRDIGLSRERIRREIEKPFWEA
ncbi:MAG: hypothetical protein NW223_16925 [Hyphomicrobiaceae bacterium]|nr:hypothetical protein [Hyphomicrobiaceae bacterium]